MICLPRIDKHPTCYTCSKQYHNQNHNIRAHEEEQIYTNIKDFMNQYI